MTSVPHGAEISVHAKPDDASRCSRSSTPSPSGHRVVDHDLRVRRCHEPQRSRPLSAGGIDGRHGHLEVRHEQSPHPTDQCQLRQPTDDNRVEECAVPRCLAIEFPHYAFTVITARCGSSPVTRSPRPRPRSPRRSPRPTSPGSLRPDNVLDSTANWINYDAYGPDACAGVQ